MTVLVAAIVLAGVPSALVSGVALPVYLPYALVGALLVVRRPRNPIGWLLVGVGWALLAGFERVPAMAELGAASMIARTRGARGLERQQVRWLVASLSPVALTIVYTFIVSGLFGDALPAKLRFSH